jgi:hypothetical protein
MVWSRRCAVLCLLTAALALASCQWRRLTVNDLIRPDDVAFIQPGRTTLAEVVAKLGPPDDIAATGADMVVRYRFRDGKYFKIDAGRLLAFWSPVTPEMSMARGQLETDVFQVVLTADGIVREHAFAFQSPATRFSPWPF